MEGTLDRNDARLALYHWPVTEPKALICLVHGLGEHAGRYQGVAEVLNKAGYALLAFDQRGHGRSEGAKGVIPSYQALMDDISALIEHGTELYHSLPVFLYGHSMGGNLVINYVLTQSHELKGVVSTSPALQIKTSAVQMLVTTFLNNLSPNFTLPNGLDSEGLSRCSKVVDQYQKDPLVHDRISVRLAHGLITSGKRARLMASTLQTPLLLMHGSKDPICLPEASIAFAGKAEEVCHFKLWDGLYHELHNEPEKQQVLAYLIDWLGQQLDS